MIKEIRLNILENIKDINNFESFIDELSDFLISVGAISVSYELSKLDSNFFFECQQDGKSKVFFNIHIPDTLDQEKFMLKVLSNYNVNFEKSFKQIPNNDWVLLSQSTHKPICIQNRIWIGTSWHKTPKNLNSEIIKILIDPGQAFGTGTHPTTRFCLEALIKFSSNQENQRMLDLGCGSGILSIAACKLGVSSVTAIDNDPLALEVAKENVSLNNINENKCLFLSDLKSSKGKFDLIVSNILFSTLLQLSSVIVKKLKENGYLVLSGILKSQVPSIKEKYLEVSQNTILLNEISSDENWVCLAFFGNHQSGD